MIRRRLWISGRVQGVGYRASLSNEAIRYPGIVGFVRNLRDGRVETVIQGPEAEVELLIAWCHKGPPRAQVTRVEIQTESVGSEFRHFDVKRDEE